MPQILTAVAIVGRCDTHARQHRVLEGAHIGLRRQAPQRVVFYRREVKAGGSKRGRGSVAIAALQHFAQPFGRLAPVADLDQAADEVAHHVVQECIGSELEHAAVAATGYVSAGALLHRRVRLALGGAKRAEVVDAEELRGASRMARHRAAGDTSPRDMHARPDAPAG